MAGATLGAIIGSYVTDDTYAVIAEVNVAIVDLGRKSQQTTIVFGNTGEKQASTDDTFTRFRSRVSSGVAVYAGGRNVPSYLIAEGVRQRFVRIVREMI